MKKIDRKNKAIYDKIMTAVSYVCATVAKRHDLWSFCNGRENRFCDPCYWNTVLTVMLKVYYPQMENIKFCVDRTAISSNLINYNSCG